MNDALIITLIEGVTNSGLCVFIEEQNPHSIEYRRYVVKLLSNGKQLICGEKGIYKSVSSAKRIYNQVIAAY